MGAIWGRTAPHFSQYFVDAGLSVLHLMQTGIYSPRMDWLRRCLFDSAAKPAAENRGIPDLGRPFYDGRQSPVCGTSAPWGKQKARPRASFVSVDRVRD